MFAPSIARRGFVSFALGLAFARLVSSPSSAASDEPGSPLSTAFVRDWLVAGPFPAGAPVGPVPDAVHFSEFEADRLAATGGEAAAAPREGDPAGAPLDGAHEPLRWRRVLSEDDALDLDSAVGTSEGVVAYAYAEIASPDDRAALLSVGSNDGVRAWLNGGVVLDAPRSRSLRLDDDVVPVALVAGANRLLLKIEERGNAWRVAARILPPDDPAASRARLLSIETLPSGAPVARTTFAEGMPAEFAEGGTVRVFREGPPGAPPLWEAEWKGEPIVALGVDPSAYGEYRLDMEIRLRGLPPLSASRAFAIGEREERVLFADGATEYAIVLAGDASESERWAAEELRRWLKEISGADFPIANEADRPALDPARLPKEILIGWSDRARSLLEAARDAATPAGDDEAFRYRNVGPAILVLGGRGRGAMYGVHALLEREFGCRWYSPSVSLAPPRERATFASLEHSESPGLRVRNDFYFEAFDPIWAARNRVNGAMGWREQPGGVEAYWSVHTFYPLVPPEEFFESHPEYFSLIDGKRTTDRAQLCLTNPEVLDILTERLLGRMRENPQYLIYSVSQNDWYGACQCDDCQAIVREEGSESGPMLKFVNAVAERVAPEFPDKLIGTLAYQYTRKPPRTLRPRENVVIRLCSIECCFAHDFASCEKNAEFLDDLRSWAAIAPRLYIWDYVVNFGHYVMPFPNFGALRGNLRAFRDNNAIGVMEQGAYQSRGAEFAELRAYVLAKLLWNPDAEVEPIVDDFMRGYYGRAGRHVHAYFDLLHARVSPDRHVFLWMPPTDPIFDDEFVRRAEAIFDEAEKVADDETILRRVETAWMPVQYLKCRLQPDRARKDGTYAKLMRVAEREGASHFAESGEPVMREFRRAMGDAPEE